MQDDVGLATAINDKDAAQVRRRLDQLARRIGAKLIVLEVTGFGRFETGTPTAIAAASGRLLDENAKDVGRITVSTTTAEDYALEVRRLLDVQVRVDRDGAVLATTSPTLENVRLPVRGRADVSAGGTDYRVSRFTAREPDDQVTIVSLFAVIEERSTLALVAVVGVVIGFLVLAFVFAVIVSRTLSSEVQRLLHAAQRLGRGDFTVTVPAEGNDEFAALGKEFNSMARQLEARLDDLRRERGRLQEAIRRVGESFARGLDRVGVLEIVVQTAVDGVGAACGRATMRRRADAPMEEVAQTGDPNAYHRALHAAEAAVMDAGEVAEISIGGDERAGRAAVGHRGRRPRAGDRLRRPRRPPLRAAGARALRLSHEPSRSFRGKRRSARDRAAPGRHRRADRPVQPPPVPGGHGRRGRARPPLRPGDGPDHAGHRQLQARQRHLRAHAGRHGPARSGAGAASSPRARSTSRRATAARRWRSRCRRPTSTARIRFAERVRQRIEALELPLLDGDGILRVTASFGAASLTAAPQSDKEGLVAAADAALYRAKRSGKNRTVKAE